MKVDGLMFIKKKLEGNKKSKKSCVVHTLRNVIQLCCKVPSYLVITQYMHINFENIEVIFGWPFWICVLMSKGNKSMCKYMFTLTLKMI